MGDKLLIGYTPPFTARKTAVYNLIEDSEGKSLFFSGMSENMDSNTLRMVEILNSAHGVMTKDVPHHEVINTPHGD